jgi:hypothetical protein
MQRDVDGGRPRGEFELAIDVTDACVVLNRRAIGKGVAGRRHTTATASKARLIAIFGQTAGEG